MRLLWLQVRIEGNVLCRCGVLMLKAENIKVLGGEVESLMADNTAENVISTALWVVHVESSTCKHSVVMWLLYLNQHHNKIFDIVDKMAQNTSGLLIKLKGIMVSSKNRHHQNYASQSITCHTSILSTCEADSIIVSKVWCCCNFLINFAYLNWKFLSSKQMFNSPCPLAIGKTVKSELSCKKKPA